MNSEKFCKISFIILICAKKNVYLQVKGYFS